MITKRFYTHRARRVAARLAIAVVVVLVAWMVIEPRTLWVDRSVLTSPDLPREFDGLRVAYVADIHAGSWLGAGQVDRMVSTVNKLRPDVIVLGGDYVAGGRGGAAMVYPRLKRLNAPVAKLAVLGNHDYEQDSQLARRGLTSAGFRVLDNDNVRIGRGPVWIRFAGLRFSWQGAQDVVAAAEDIAVPEFSVLVSHNPDAFAEGLPATPGAFDLALAGHTHGGQGTLFGLWAPFLPKQTQYGNRYRSNWRVEEGVPILVSRGVGVGVFPARFMAPPQVHLIELRRGTAGVEM